MRIYQRGISLVNAALAVLMSTLILLISVPAISRAVDNFQQKQELERFVSEAFIAAKLNYFNQANASGSCFSTVPPAAITSTLISLGMLDAKWSNDNFFDSALSTVTYSAGSAGGRVDTMELVIPLITSSTTYYQLPYFTYGDNNEVRFRKNIDFRNTTKSAMRLDTNFCHG